MSAETDDWWDNVFRLIEEDNRAYREDMKRQRDSSAIDEIAESYFNSKSDNE